MDGRNRSLENVQIPTMLPGDKTRRHRGKNRRNRLKATSGNVNEKSERQHRISHSSDGSSGSPKITATKSKAGSRKTGASLSEPHLWMKGGKLTTGTAIRKSFFPLTKSNISAELQKLSPFRHANNPRYSRRRTTCLDTREASKIVQTLSKRAPERRRRRKRKRRKGVQEASARERPSAGNAKLRPGGSPAHGVSISESERMDSRYRRVVPEIVEREMMAAVSGKKTAQHLHRPDSYPSIFEPSYLEILTQSSSDEDDRLHGRRRSTFFDIMKPMSKESLSSEASLEISEPAHKLDTLKVPSPYAGFPGRHYTSIPTGEVAQGSRSNLKNESMLRSGSLDSVMALNAGASLRRQR